LQNWRYNFRSTSSWHPLIWQICFYWTLPSVWKHSSVTDIINQLLVLETQPISQKGKT